MGRRHLQLENAAMLDNDDADIISSSLTDQWDMLGSSTEQVLSDKDTILDQCLDALYEKRGSTRVKALTSIVEVFNDSLQHEFVEKKFLTLLHRCLNSIKKGSTQEITLASRVIGLLALMTGCGKKAQEILEESVSPISEALRSCSDSSKILSSLLECLAILTFVGGEETEATEKSIQVMWQVIHPKLGRNGAVVKRSPPATPAVLSAWSFLLTIMDRQTVDLRSWQESISHFSTLLDNDDRSIRIAAGETLVLIFEVGGFNKLCGEIKLSSDISNKEAKKSQELVYIRELRNKVLDQVRILSAEAGGKGINKKNLSTQRSTFRDILEFFEYGNSPQTSIKIGRDSMITTTWAGLIQLNFLKHFLEGGFLKHMKENEFLHDVFGFKPTQEKSITVAERRRIAEVERRLFKSPNSVVKKARTQFLNKQRKLSQARQDMNVGFYAEEEA